MNCSFCGLTTFIKNPRAQNRLTIGSPLEGLRLIGAGEEYFRLFSASAFLFALSAGSSVCASPYEPTELHPLSGYSNSFATDVNNVGEVIGYSTDGYPGNSNGPAFGPTFGNEISIATAWISGNPIALKPLPSYQSSYALAINDLGQVVGYSIGSQGAQVATIWTGTAPSALFGLPGGQSSVASGINDSGDVSGTTWIGSGYPTLWKHGLATELKVPFGQSGQALGINNTGTVAGYTSQATMWNNGNFTQLKPLFGVGSGIAFNVNSSGDSVGYSSCGFQSCAVVWHDDTATYLGPNLTGTSQALDINDTGSIVGWGPSGPILWKEGSLIDLEMPVGDTDGEATAINNHGLIVGYTGIALGSETTFEATIWSVPEPSTWAMMLFGFAALGYAGYRRVRIA